MCGITSEGWEKSARCRSSTSTVPDLLAAATTRCLADGERIVVNTFISDPVVPPIDVVVNWQGLLKQ